MCPNAPQVHGHSLASAGLPPGIETSAEVLDRTEQTARIRAAQSGALPQIVWTTRVKERRYHLALRGERRAERSSVSDVREGSGLRSGLADTGQNRLPHLQLALIGGRP